MHRALIPLVLGLAAGVGGTGLAGCGSPPPPPVFHVTFTALADTLPLPGVQVMRGTRVLGTTDPLGKLEVRLHGQDGTTITYRVQCPTGYRTPPTPPPLVLRQFRAVAVPGQPPRPRGIEVTLQCPPSQRYAAVVVRAGGVAGLPVTMQGQMITRTDSSGVAHFMLPLAPNSQFALALDTSSNPYLKPENPTASFTLADNDDILIFDPPLHEERPPPVHVHHAVHHVSHPTGPIRIR